MKSEITIEAAPRERLGKGGARQLRREGRVPVTLYGGEEAKALSLSLDQHELMGILRSAAGLNTIFQLTWDGGSSPVILKDWQVDPLKGTLLHADLIRINMAKVTRVRVPVELEGEPIGVKTQGGLLDFATHFLEVECLPADIPDRIRIDVSGLRVGDHVSVKDLDLGESVRILEEPGRVIASLFASRVEAAPTPAVTEEAVAETEAPKPAKGEAAEESGK